MLNTSFIPKAIYLFSIMLAGMYCFKKPFYNWDLLPYTVLVLKMDHHNTKEAHDLAYQFAQRNIPPKNYRQLTDSTHAYRNSMHNNTEAFNKQLPFYVVKPLYIGLIYLFYKSGISLPQATLLPPLLSYLFIGLLLFYWLSKYLSRALTFMVALLTMLSTPLIEVAKTSSPDCLSAFLLFASFYFILEKPSLRTAFILMTLSVFARLDNILTCVLIPGIIFFSKRWYKAISFTTFSLMLLLLLASYILISSMTTQYGWNIFFYGDFAGHLHPAYGTGEHFSLKNYGTLVYEHIMNGLNHSYIVLFMALLSLNFTNISTFKKLPLDQLLALLIPFLILLRFILYPDISDRFYIVFYLMIIVFLTKRLKHRQQVFHS